MTVADELARRAARLLYKEDCKELQAEIRQAITTDARHLAIQQLNDWIIHNKNKILSYHFGETGFDHKFSAQWINKLARRLHSDYWEDLVQIGNKKLFERFGLYNIELALLPNGATFLTFAYKYVKFAMIEFLQAQSLMRKPKRYNRIIKAHDALMYEYTAITDEHASMPTLADITNRLNQQSRGDPFTEKEVEESLEYQSQVGSISSYTNEESEEQPIEGVPDNREAANVLFEKKDLVNKMLESLRNEDPKKCQLLIDIYFKGLKYEEIARNGITYLSNNGEEIRVHPSQTSLRQMLHRALEQLKEYFVIHFSDKKSNYNFLSNSFSCQMQIRGHTFEDAWEAYKFLVSPISNVPGIYNDKNRLSEMERVLAVKFKDKELGDKLSKTLDATLKYDSDDEFWGCGLDGTGHNNLGELLEKQRLHEGIPQKGGEDE